MNLNAIADAAWEMNQTGTPPEALDQDLIAGVFEIIEQLDQGKIRVCEKVDGQWRTNEWTKKAILLYFRLQKMTTIQAGDINYFDKIPVKHWTGKEGVRIVPHAIARKGSFIATGAILMPSYVNIGAYVDSGTMVDTWATVGSCAQIGKNVHLSGGVGIGGVLEPIQANPVIIEDHVFVGSRCIVVEGAVIEEGAVLGAGVTITASTKIIDVTGSQEKIYQGRVPKNSVVIPGTLMKKFPAGEYGTPCALIIGQRKASTDLKTSLTSALRDFEVSV
jgi:2,3,4,5-tetrahydropyridine-2-carboxylate N-succinyltransferase